MKKILSYILVVLIFGFLFWNIVQNWSVVSSISWNFDNIGLIWFLFFITFIYISNIFSWHVITRLLGLKLSLVSNTKIWMISNFSRFIPGGIWQYPSRVVLLSRKKVSKRLAVTAVLIEGLMTLSFGAGTVIFTLAFWELPVKYQALQGILWVFLFLPLLIFLFTNKKIFDKTILIYSKLTKREKVSFESIKIERKQLPLLFLSFFARFFFIGGALFFLIRLASPISYTLFPMIVGIYAFSWLLGYISFFAPAGLGVTEITLAALLSFYIPFSLGAVLAVVFRVVILIAEAIFLFASCIIKEDSLS